MNRGIWAGDIKSCVPRIVPQQEDEHVRYVVAIVGSVIVFIGVFVISGIAVASIAPQLLRLNIGIGLVKTNNIVGLVLGGLAAASSARATLRRYKKRSEKRSGNTD